MITIKDLRFAYAGKGKMVNGKSAVYEGFNLSFEENKVYGLLGENGSGKSTLLYLIAGLLRPNTGEVCLDEVPTKERRAETLADIFIVPENYDLPDMKLSQFIKINSAFYPNFSEETLQSCLAMFEMPSDTSRKLLAMGQKKRIYLSFALATHTRILLLDEPTNGLDIPSKSLFRRVIAEHAGDKRTVIISTHQVHDIAQLIDHVVCLGTEGLLLNAPMSEISKRFVFNYLQPGSSVGEVLYSEATLQGLAIIEARYEGMPETEVNLELLFNALIHKRINL